MTATTLEIDATVTAPDGIVRTHDLTKVYPGTDLRAIDALEPFGGHGRDLRAARPQRRGKDHDGGNPHDSGHSDLGQGVHRRHRRRRPSGPGQQARRGRLADQHARPAAQRRGRTCTTTGGSSGSGRRSLVRSPTSSSGSSSSRNGPKPRSTRSREEWPNASWWHGPSSTSPPCSSWTSRRPVSRPRAASLLWDILREPPTPRARPSSSPPTTWRRRPALRPGRHHGPRQEFLALDTPARLKQGVGAGTIVTVKAVGDQQRTGRGAAT